jgi:hypothetical protein
MEFDCTLQKSFRLQSSGFIQTAVNPAALNNAFQIQICLAVANNVYFFGVQFSAILAAKIGK